MKRKTTRPVIGAVLKAGLGLVMVCGAGGLLGGCSTRTVVLTNTSGEQMELRSTGDSSGWDYSRTLEPGESFRMKVGRGQPIRLPTMTVQAY